MTATSRDELKSAQASGRPIRLAVRPPGGLTETLSDVVVTEVTDTEVTVRHRGESRTVAIDSLVDIDTEAQQRRFLRRVGRLFDILGLTR